MTTTWSLLSSLCNVMKTEWATNRYEAATLCNNETSSECRTAKPQVCLTLTPGLHFSQLSHYSSSRTVGGSNLNFWNHKLCFYARMPKIAMDRQMLWQSPLNTSKFAKTPTTTTPTPRPIHQNAAARERDRTKSLQMRCHHMDRTRMCW